MKNKIYLRKNIKYRKERKFILLCDCINFIDFELPLKYYPFLEKLTNGIEPNSSISSNEKELLLDLYDMDFLTENKESISENKNTLSNLSYDESDFFQS